MSTTTTTIEAREVYPPKQLACPQFVVPFGAANGARAAYRVFLGSRAQRHLRADEVGLERLSDAWEQVRQFPWPLKERHPIKPSFVDLDPQVEDVAKCGEDAHLTLALLVAAMMAFEDLDERAQASFFSRVASIWALGCITGEGMHLTEDGLDSRVARFCEFCQADPSDRRHLLCVPSSARDLIAPLLEPWREELDIIEHTFVAEESLPEVFFGEVAARMHIMYVPDDGASEIAAFFDDFEQTWRRAHEQGTWGRSSGELSPGSMLGERYTIAKRLGAGGFAVVYEARDDKVDRQVAIKVIDLERSTDELHRPTYIKRFQREAKLAAKVKHACIVEIYDVGVVDGTMTPYMVMERLEGWDLEHQIRRYGAMPPERILPLFVEVLEGLGCAHEAGIIHKDLKPSNIFLRHPNSRREQLCILDFGVARQADADTGRLTRSDSVFGTPYYMAPEYSTSQITTPSLDVYQMGLILVELLMGSPVIHQTEPIVAMFQHVRGDLHIPAELLDGPLGPVIRRALALEYEARFADGFAFADALRAIDTSAMGALPVKPRLVPLNPTHAADTSDAYLQQTPRVGQLKLDTDEHRAAHAALAPTIDAPRADTAQQALLQDAKDRAISPASLERLRGVIPREPPKRTQETDTAPEEADQKDEKSLDDEPIVSYRSRAPYVAVTTLLSIGLAVALWFLFTGDDPAPKPSGGDVVTEYDRDLQELRARADRLPELLEEGRLEELIDEVEAMDKEEAKLTPSEVEQVRVLVESARAERPNRRLLDRALKEANQRDYLSALKIVRELPQDSVFRSHPDLEDILDRAKIALLPRIQQLRFEGRHEDAEVILLSLLAHYPDNPELRVLLMELQADVREMSYEAYDAAYQRFRAALAAARRAQRDVSEAVIPRELEP